MANARRAERFAQQPVSGQGGNVLACPDQLELDFLLDAADRITHPCPLVLFACRGAPRIDSPLIMKCHPCVRTRCVIFAWMSCYRGSHPATAAGILAAMTDDDDEPQPRRMPRPVTKAWLQRAALYYLERYAAPAGHLRQVLMRKVDKRLMLRSEAQDEQIVEPARALVEEVVTEAVEGGYVDDGAYARARVASLRRRGGSQRAIRARLMQKGVPADLVDEALEADGEEAAPVSEYGQAGQDALAAREREAALAYARRRRLGPFRLRERAERRERDIAAMVRAGFALSLARSVIDSV